MKKVLLFLGLVVFGMFTVISATERNEKNNKPISKHNIMNKVSVNEVLSRDEGSYSINKLSSGFEGGIIWLEDFEPGVPWYNWTAVDLRPEPAPAFWALNTWQAIGDSSWHCADTTLGNYGGYDNSWYQVLDTPPIIVNDTSATLTFWHRYFIESPGGEPAPYDGWDGINVRISVDSGATWEVLPLATYNVTCSWAFGHPDQGFNEGTGIPSWAGEQQTWTNESFDLKEYIKTDTVIMIRFALASDRAFSTVYYNPEEQGDQNMFGWQVDSIEIKSPEKTFYTNYGTKDNMTKESFRLPTGGSLWHIAELLPPDTLPVYIPEFTPSPTHAAVCQIGGDLFQLNSTYNAYMDNSFETGPISLPDTTPIYLDYKYVPYFTDSDEFPDVEYFRPEVCHIDSANWEWIEDDPYVYSTGYDKWVEFAWMYGYPVNMSMFDLSRFAGQSIYLRFRFWSDWDDPAGPGLLIDDVVIYSPINPPAPPQNVAAVDSPADTSIIVSWDYTEDISFQVWRMTPGSEYLYLQAELKDSVYVDQNIDPFQEYWYYIKAAVKYEGTSDWSDGAAALVIPAAFSELSYDDSESDGHFEIDRSLLTMVKFTPKYYPVEFSTIKIHLDTSLIDGVNEPQGKAKFYVYDVDSATGLPGEQIAYIRVSSGLEAGFNFVHFDNPVTIDSAMNSFFVGHMRYTRSHYISTDTSPVIDCRTYFQYEDTTITGADTTKWAAEVDSFDAMIHVFLDTTKANIPDTTGIDFEKNLVVDNFVLGKNYPNPFNPVTTIPFNVPVKAIGKNIKLEIFNILGQKVVTLFDGKAKAGVNQVIWKGNNQAGELISSGIYIYHLKCDNIKLSRRMLFIK